MRSHYIRDVDTVTTFPYRGRGDQVCVGFSADGQAYGAIFNARLVRSDFVFAVTQFLIGNAKPIFADEEE
ncbi:MAG: hypothetical protein M3Q22_06890 [Actinomycetota bacterium]|nr:hypothetical protein [Actinomycetota bacterium]